MATVALDALPPPVATRVLQLLPVADRVRAGGVSPAWRALAHAPALYGPELVLADALDAPRTVSDTAEALSRDYMSRHAILVRAALQLALHSALAFCARRRNAHAPGCARYRVALRRRDA